MDLLKKRIETFRNPVHEIDLSVEKIGLRLIVCDIGPLRIQAMLVGRKKRLAELHGEISKVIVERAVRTGKP